MSKEKLTQLTDEELKALSEENEGVAIQWGIDSRRDRFRYSGNSSISLAEVLKQKKIIISTSYNFTILEPLDVSEKKLLKRVEYLSSIIFKGVYAKKGDLLCSRDYRPLINMYNEIVKNSSLSGKIPLLEECPDLEQVPDTEQVSKMNFFSEKAKDANKSIQRIWYKSLAEKAGLNMTEEQISALVDISLSEFRNAFNQSYYKAKILFFNPPSNMKPKIDFIEDWSEVFSHIEKRKNKKNCRTRDVVLELVKDHFIKESSQEDTLINSL